jgi:hypothetical protein
MLKERKCVSIILIPFEFWFLARAGKFVGCISLQKRAQHAVSSYLGNCDARQSYAYMGVKKGRIKGAENIDSAPLRK